MAKTATPSGCRALVPLDPRAHPGMPVRAARQSAAFLAHLIATRQQAPQTRSLRRGDSGAAVACYAATRAAAGPGRRPVAIAIR